MRFFLYEFVTAGGLLGLPAPPTSLLAEGSAMLAAAAADFALLADAEVWITWGRRLACPPKCRVFDVNHAAEEQATFARLAAEAHWTLLIAPETGGELLRRCQLVEALGGRLLSPPSACIKIAASKQHTADHLARHGIRVPPGTLFTPQFKPANRLVPKLLAPKLLAPKLRLGASASEAPLPESEAELPAGKFPSGAWEPGGGTSRWKPEIEFPLVAKPVDGCGSQGVRLINSSSELDSLPADGSLRLERHVAGLPASVAVLCGPAGKFALPACEQRLSTDGRFTYLGGRLPLDAHLNERAQQLALAAVGCLPAAHGYLGVDLILGQAPDGSQDFVIEINPRLTTSYIGLRACSRTNLAAAMLAVGRGQSPDLSFANSTVEFTSDGTVQHHGSVRCQL